MVVETIGTTGLGNYFEVIKKLNNMQRWATEFMHNRPTVSENSFAVTQIGQMLAIIEENEGNTINWDRLARKLINTNVLEALTGHLTHLIKDKNEEFNRMLSYIEEKIANEQLLSKMPTAFRDQYQLLLFDRKDQTLEGKILNYSNKIATLMECIEEIRLSNKEPFQEKYDEIISKLQQSELVSVSYFLEVVLPQLEGKDVGIGNYLLAMKKLSNMGRWATEFAHRRTTVSEHSFSVAQTGQMLALIEEMHGNRVNWGYLLKYHTNHDVLEALTGDIISTVKHKKEEMKILVEIIEKEIAEEKLLCFIPDPYKEVYRKLLFTGKDETMEGQLLTASDNIDALLECVSEIKLANLDPFMDKYKSILSKVREIELVSVQYFLNNILPEIIAGVPELHNL